MKRLALVCLMALALASPAAARPASVRVSRAAVSSWLSRAWSGLFHAVIGSFRLFDGDGGEHTLPPPQSTMLTVGS